MHRATTTFLSRLHQRVPISLAHTLLAAYAPKFTRDLHLFVRRDKIYAEVEVKDGAYVADLKDAVISKLMLVIAPDRVRLLREVDGQDPVLLDSCKQLAEEGVHEGSMVLMEVIAPDAPATSSTESAALKGGKRLLSALRAAELEAIPSSRSSLIKLPEGVLWPQLGAEPLFVRDFYCGLYEGVLASCDLACIAQKRKFIIRGSAGIGKSAFGAYMLWRAVKEKRTVVYTSDKVPYSFTFHSSGQVEVFPSWDFRQHAWEILNEPSTVFICDGIMPSVVNAFTVLITSPKRERYREYRKLVDSQMLAVPVFFRHEIRDIHRTCFPKLDEDEVWELYRKWGGIVRYVLANQDLDSQKSLLSALASVDLDGLLFDLSADEIESDSKASHRLLHLKPVGEGRDEFSDPYNIDSYMLDRIELASEYVAEIVYSAMQQHHYQRLTDLLARPIVSASCAKLYGDLYESAAARVLLKGGAFEAFDCSAGAQVAGGVIVTPCTKHVFSNANDLRSANLARQGQPTMYTPASPSFTAVDAVLPGNILVNFTIDLKHEVKMYGGGSKASEGAAPVADAMGVSGDIVFYWVLPEDAFRKACKAGKPFPVTGQQAGNARTLKQFFVCVPFAFGGR